MSSSFVLAMATRACDAHAHAASPQASHGSDAMQALIGAFTDAYHAPGTPSSASTTPLPLPVPKGPPPLGSILQLVRETGKTRAECKDALKACGNDFNAAHKCLLPATPVVLTSVPIVGPSEPLAGADAADLAVSVRIASSSIDDLPEPLDSADAAELDACSSLIDDRPALLRRLQRRHKIGSLANRQRAANALAKAVKSGSIAQPPAVSPPNVSDIRTRAHSALIDLRTRAGAGEGAALGDLLDEDEIDSFIHGEPSDDLTASLRPATVYRVLEATDAVPPTHARLLQEALELGSPRIAFWTQQMTERGTEGLWPHRLARRSTIR